MTLKTADIDTAAKRLAVRFPNDFVKAITTLPLSELVSWQVLHPTEWHRIENDDKYRGAPGVVFGDDRNGGYYFLSRSDDGSGELSPVVWMWDIHERSPRKVAPRLALIPEVIERMADELLESDEEDRSAEA